MAIENSSTQYIVDTIEAQRNYFRQGATLDISLRKEALQRPQKVGETSR